MHDRGKFAILSAYRFIRLSESRLTELESVFRALSRYHAIRGLIITAPEGVNFTLSARKSGMDVFEQALLALEGFEATDIKRSWADSQPFRRFKIKRRTEIVTLDREEIFPNEEDETHLSPQEWERVLTEDLNVLLLDTRNSYETALGKFRGAIDPEIQSFSDFPEFVQRLDIPLDTKVLMYCTGGIRCEKASVEMRRRGFKNVYQLRGGILRYLEQFPDKRYEGECFVFDHRVAVQQDLRPSEAFRLCPHCGDPGVQRIDCDACQVATVVCKSCLSIPFRNTCSKNCAHHAERRASLPQRKSREDGSPLSLEDKDSCRK